MHRLFGTELERSVMASRIQLVLVRNWLTTAQCRILEKGTSASAQISGESMTAAMLRKLSTVGQIFATHHAVVNMFSAAKQSVPVDDGGLESSMAIPEL